MYKYGFADTPEKYYFSAPGLRNARIRFCQFEQAHSMENVIYRELYMREYGIPCGCRHCFGSKKDKNKSWIINRF